MGNNKVELKPVKDVLGMRFNIPEYQRGYRWEEQQARDLLNDIWSFANDEKKKNSEIYCIQPLVVQQRSEDMMTQVRKAINVDEVTRILKGSWDVVDGQQRLTTIFLILSVLGCKTPYTIDYETRNGSKDFLENITEEKKTAYIDFYHIYLVNKTICEWLAEKEKDPHYLNEGEKIRNKLKETLLEKVNFIWYQIDEGETSDGRSKAIATFTRLNIGKIPLTDSELIKALFLNRSKYEGDTELDEMQRKIAREWDEVEYALQNEEFWLFIHDSGYSEPTRIDFILDIIRDYNLLGLKIGSRRPNDIVTKSGVKIPGKYNNISDHFGKDEHKTFRYFYRVFGENTVTAEWLKTNWGLIYEFYQVLNEWYHDYKLYHYVGYLTSVRKKEKISELIAELVNVWRESSKETFMKEIKNRIGEELCRTKGFLDLDEFIYDVENDHNDTTAKSECVPILLLHNIETVIQQNNKLVSDKKYALPDFSKFPFHLYKSEHWDVEHIRPNAGDKITTTNTERNFLILAKPYIKRMDGADELSVDIDKYLNGETDAKPFEDIHKSIVGIEKTLGDSDKNKIWNFTLLDSSTNKEYSNSIFPIKRAFLSYKERGKKVEIKDGVLDHSRSIDEIAFVPPCTRNVFAKFYTDMPNDMLEWTEEDARAYLQDMKNKLEDYLNEYQSGGAKA